MSLTYYVHCVSLSRPFGDRINLALQKPVPTTVPKQHFSPDSTIDFHIFFFVCE